MLLFKTVHISSVHEGKKHFTCSICDYKHSKQGSLAKHIASVHESKEPFKCSQKNDLTCHITVVHFKNTQET